ncbi:phage tail protein [Chloroflexales bacterium ZM16-3]|nr:phage tail protein [Chloroflexales bacterium ZM16-3]
MTQDDNSKQEANPACRFYVEIDKIAKAVFTEVSGLQIETEVTTYAEGGNNGFARRLPGRTTVSNLTLKRGVTSTHELLRWYLDIVSGKIDRRQVSVIQYSLRGEPIARWNFSDAYPVKWVGPQLTADSSVIAIETLELAHEGIALGT